MQWVGFGFDRERAARLSEALLVEEKRQAAILFDACGCLNALSPKQLGEAFFGGLRAPVIYRSNLTRRPSLGVEAMRAYAGFADERLRRAALAVLALRRARKCRSTYVDKPLMLSLEAPDGRVHPSWLNYGAVSGRWSCQSPNLANLPRPDNDPIVEMRKAGVEGLPDGGLRGLYRAPPGYVLVHFDASQLEFRVAAYASGDPTMLAACLSTDIHATNAATIWPGEMDPAEFARLKKAVKAGKATLEEAERFGFLDRLRSMAKQSGFAVCYLAESQTVYERIIAAGLDVSMQAVNAMMSRLHRNMHVYFAWQGDRLLDVIRTGYAVEPVTGRVRWLGHDPSPTEAANLPIQGGAAGLLNTRLPAIVDALDERGIRAHLVASVYDSGTFEVRTQDAVAVEALCHEVFEAPLMIEGREARFPIETKISERWQ